MLIREANAGDAAAIASFIVMAEGEMAQLFTGLDDPAKSAEALIPLVLSPVPSRYSLENNLVVEMDGKAAAAVMSFHADRQPELDIPLLASLKKRGLQLDSLTFEGEPGTYYLSTMGVDPAHRGKGLGTALIAAAQEKGRRLGFDRLSLLVSKEKGKAKALYQRLGFEAVSDVDIAGFEYERMVKAI